MTAGASSDTFNEAHLRAAFEVARRARAHGNHPFGAILVDGGQVLLAAENTVVTGRDPTGHAELNLVREAGKVVPWQRMAGMTLYTSAEPCPMCAGAMVWGNVRRVVFGVGMAALYEAIAAPPDAPALRMNARRVFEAAPWQVEVVGPKLVQEALGVHEGFW
ncbi:MAG: nucleoside deaminase [Gammaproteobacteria bacterium]|nr:nucleoside deaminase [Gammaproteobacteria bacterium]